MYSGADFDDLQIALIILVIGFPAITLGIGVGIGWLIWG